MRRLRYSRNPTWKISHLQLLPVMAASDSGLRQLPGAASDYGQLPEVGPDNKANQPLQFDIPKRHAQRAVESIITIPRTTSDVGELLSSAHAAEKRANRQCLVTIAETCAFSPGKGLLCVEMVMKVTVISCSYCTSEQ